MSAPSSTTTRLRLWGALFVLLIGFAGAGFLWLKIQYDPTLVLLLPEKGAVWIKFDKDFYYGIYRFEAQVTAFRTSLTVDQPPEKAILTVRVLKDATYFIDGKSIFPVKRDTDSWKTPRELDLTPYLSPGKHELSIKVVNEDGPCVMLAHCEELGIRSGEDWEATRGDMREKQMVWTNAVHIAHFNRTELTKSGGTVAAAFRKQWPILAIIFGAVFAATLAYSRGVRLPDRIARVAGSVSALRWLLIAAWVVLALNNNWKLRFSIGFDAWAHISYILHIYHKHALPYATDGWQMFQSPLYYLIGVAAMTILRDWLHIAPTDAWNIVRLLSHLCGLLQVELCYRAAVYAFPDRKDLQRIALLVGSLMPINLYISQFYSNEPLVGLLTAAAAVYVIGAFRKPAVVRKVSWMWTLGALVGLAILTKFTAVLMVPILAAAATWLLWENGMRLERIATRLVQYGVAIVAICGWYFVRNEMKFGKPFVGGWDPLRGFLWWQQPGYRTPKQLYSFGESLIYPVYSSPVSFLDTIYSTMWLDSFLSGKAGKLTRPPWQYDFIHCSPWLSILPTLGIILGMFVAFRYRDLVTRKILLFSAACVGIYFAALAYLYLSLPIFSTAKASYTLGLLPCYGVLCAAGLSLLTRQAFFRATVYGALACWCVFAYVGYFVTMPLERFNQLMEQEHGKSGAADEETMERWKDPATWGSQFYPDNVPDLPTGEDGSKSREGNVPSEPILP